MRNKVIGGILAAGVVATIGTTVAVAARNGGTPPKRNGPAMGVVQTIAAARPGGRWTSLPPAPIVGRSDAVGIWTGDQMLVWGGTDPSGNRDYADGATYDPTTRRWSTLPPAPLSARSATASVWTGRALFVWGGTDARGHTDNDGAIYDPSTRHWTKLDAAPVPAHSSAQAMWTGKQILLLTAPPGRTSDHLTLQAYDPATQRWTVLPTLHLRAEHDAMTATAVLAGPRLLVWSGWSHAIRTHDGFEVVSGIDGFSFDLARQVWAPDAFTWRGHDSVDAALWTGRQVLIPASQLWCGYCPGPFNPHSAGTRVDPRTRAVRTIPHGPADDLGATYLWTGSVLLAADTTGGSSGPGGPNVYPGITAYWQPSTDTWVRLPSAPLAGGDAVTVWTGHSLLVWGQLFPIHQFDPARPHTAGLQLSR